MLDPPPKRYRQDEEQDKIRHGTTRDDKTRDDKTPEDTRRDLPSSSKAQGHPPDTRPIKEPYMDPSIADASHDGM